MYKVFFVESSPYEMIVMLLDLKMYCNILTAKIWVGLSWLLASSVDVSRYSPNLIVFYWTV